MKDDMWNAKKRIKSESIRGNLQVGLCLKGRSFKMLLERHTYRRLEAGCTENWSSTLN